MLRSPPVMAPAMRNVPASMRSGMMRCFAPFSLLTPTIRVKSVSKLKSAEHRIIPERSEAGTFLIAGAMTGGDLNIAGCDPAHLEALLSKLKEVGVKTKSNSDSVRVMGDNPLDR